MAKVIIGLHGLANKPPKKALQEWWGRALIEGLERNCGLNAPKLNFDFVYWANYLYKQPLHSDPAYSFDDHYNDEPYLPAADRALKRYDEGFIDDVRRVSGRLLGSALDWTKETFGIEATANFVLAKTLKDLSYYWDPERQLRDRDGNMRQAYDVLQDDLRVCLEKHGNDSIMLIAHSMGSIIAYDVLRDIGQEEGNVAVPYFVTIGSPLGLSHVKKKTVDTRKYAGKKSKRLRTPTIVTQDWTNFADPLDPVAFDSHLRDDYRENRSNVRVRDDLVSNDYQAPDGSHNHHKSYGYLRTPELSAHVAKFLGLR